jgi:hypothetical protein
VVFSTNVPALLAGESKIKLDHCGDVAAILFFGNDEIL